MKEKLNSHFQDIVSEFLIRHYSILDTTSKFQEACARVNRAISKSVTNCGCLKIKAEKQRIPTDAKLSEIKKYMDNHLEGKLCATCREVIEEEIGTSLFYLTAICNLLRLDLEDIIKQECEKINTLGIYSLT